MTGPRRPALGPRPARGDRPQGGPADGARPAHDVHARSPRRSCRRWSSASRWTSPWTGYRRWWWTGTGPTCRGSMRPPAARRRDAPRVARWRDARRGRGRAGPTGWAAAAVIIPDRASPPISAAGRPAEVQVVLDGTDPNRSVVAGGAASRYFGEVGERLARERLAAAGVGPAPAQLDARAPHLLQPHAEDAALHGAGHRRHAAAGGHHASSPPWAWRASGRWGRWSRCW